MEDKEGVMSGGGEGEMPQQPRTTTTTKPLFPHAPFSIDSLLKPELRVGLASRTDRLTSLQQVDRLASLQQVDRLTSLQQVDRLTGLQQRLHGLGKQSRYFKY